MYIKSVKADLLAEPKKGSEVVLTIQRGEKVKELESQKTWVKVESAGKQGWLSRLFLAKNPSAQGPKSLLSEGEDLSSTSRKRASALTSAGAARGLRQDSQKIFTIDGKENFADLAKMEALSISEQAALGFLENDRELLKDE